jgi:hypothetical protein
MSAKRKLRVDAIFPTPYLHLLQAHPLRNHERRIKIAQRRAAPQTQRVAQYPRCLSMSAVRQRLVSALAIR